jgi:predicted HicB family RNase H-like nuclease
METLSYKGYSGTIEYSKEDKYLFGKVLDMSNHVISYVGKNIEELKADFEAGVDFFWKLAKTEEQNLKL